MYMMFIYCNRKPYNGMGIRGSLEELYKQAENITKDIFLLNPKADVAVKITMYI